MRSRKLARLLSLDASAEKFLELAKSYQASRRTRSSWDGLIAYCENRDYGCSRANVAELSDPTNWSRTVSDEGRKPRIAIKIDVNQRGNLVITHNGGADKIVFPEDFSKQFWAVQTMRGWHASPDPCNLMWVPDFNHLCGSAYHTRNPVAQSLWPLFTRVSRNWFPRFLKSSPWLQPRLRSSSS